MPLDVTPPTMAKPTQAARLFAALADPTRLALLVILRSGPPRSIVRLSNNAGMTRQAVTKHLRVLEDTGFVIALREGRETRYSYRTNALDTARNALDAIAGNWDAVRTPAPRQDQPDSA